MAIAPSVIQEAMVEIVDSIPGAIYAGIVGDVNHSFGYHLAPEDLPPGDYSRQLARDRNGIEDNAASALDITNRTPELWATTARLRDAAKAGDPRLYGLREFAGTLDGRTTYNFDLSTGREGFGVWDSSHLFHNHLSGYRDCTRNRGAWLAIAEVMIGTPLDGSTLQPTTPEEDDMTPDQAAQLARIASFVDLQYTAGGRTPLQEIALRIDGTGRGDQDDMVNHILPALRDIRSVVRGQDWGITQLLAREDADPQEVAERLADLLGLEMAAKVAPLLTIVAGAK